MTQRTFKKNYEVRLQKLEVLSKNDIYVSVIVEEKETGRIDYYSWTPDCMGAEPWYGRFHEPYMDIDLAIQDYITENIWFGPIKLAEPSEVKSYEQLEENL
jgi:hypothetical protein